MARRTVTKVDVVRWAAMGAAAVVVALEEDEEKPRRTHRYWVKPWIKERDNQKQQNTMLKLYRELIDCGDIDEFRATVRMPPETWQYLLEKVEPHISKEDTNFRDAHSAELKLAVALRYMALGDNYLSIAQQFRIGRSTVGKILREVFIGINDALKDEYGKTPKTEEKWLKIAQEFNDRWNMPHALGAIDGKHIRIQCPPNGGSVFYNYKGYHSIVLLAVCDANYRIIYYDVGAEGKASDGGIWRWCSLKRDIDDPCNPLNIPADRTLTGIEGKLSYFLLGDDAFGLSRYLMKPYPQSGLTKQERIYNYRVSRARRMIENTFGILTSRFRIFHQEINMAPDAIDLMVRAAVLLHNMLREKCGKTYIPRASVDNEEDEHNVIPGNWRNQEALPSLEATRKRNATHHAKNIREHLAEYFVSRHGSVPWQYKLA